MAVASLGCSLRYKCHNEGDEQSRELEIVVGTAGSTPIERILHFACHVWFDLFLFEHPSELWVQVMLLQARVDLVQVVFFDRIRSPGNFKVRSRFAFHRIWEVVPEQARIDSC